MNRAASPVLATLLLTAVAVVVAGTAGVVATSFAQSADPASPVELTASANATNGRIVLVHGSGSAIDVRAIDVRIAVDGTPLSHQPPVPFTGSTGFRGAPSGPFNGAADPRWEVGERATFEIAGTNDPSITSGSTIRIELYRDDLPVASVETIAG